MPAEDFLRVLDSVRGKLDPRRITVALTGGEPLLRNDLEQTGAEIARRGFPWGMVSNGYDLTARRIDSLVRSGLSALTISLDGLAGSHDWLRSRKGSFDRACRAISEAAGKPLAAFDVVTCLNRRNVDELDQIRALLVGMGVRAWRIISVFPRGRAEGNPDLHLDAAGLRRALDFIVETRRAGAIRASYGCDGFLGGYEKEVRDDFMFCQAGIGIASVLCDGSISACPGLRNEFVQGSIYRDDFLDCWENRFQVMRDRRWARTGRCSGCSHWRWCGGNGLHLRHEKTRELMMCQLAELEEGDRGVDHRPCLA